MKKCVFVLLACLAFGCKSTSVDKNDDGLRYKESVTINDVPKASVTFFEVNEDSRCPEGGVCVWQGRVVVDLLFSGVTTEGGVQEHAKMCLGACNPQLTGSDTLNKSFAGENYQLVLSAVNPYPKTDQDRKKEDYSLQLKIVKK